METSQDGRFTYTVPTQPIHPCASHNSEYAGGRIPSSATAEIALSSPSKRARLLSLVSGALLVPAAARVEVGLSSGRAAPGGIPQQLYEAARTSALALLELQAG